MVLNLTLDRISKNSVKKGFVWKEKKNDDLRVLENVALCGRWVPFTATSALMAIGVPYDQ